MARRPAKPKKPKMPLPGMPPPGMPLPGMKPMMPGMMPAPGKKKGAKAYAKRGKGRMPGMGM